MEMKLNINRILKKSVKVTQEHVEELNYEILEMNIKRERFLGGILILIILILISLDIYARQNPSVGDYISPQSFYIHICLLLMPILFLTFTYGKKIDKKNYMLFRCMHFLITISVLVSCSFIAINNEMDNQRPFAYVVAMFSIASMLLLDMNERIFIYFSSYLIYIIGHMVFVDGLNHFIEDTFFSIPLLVLALIVSNTNYNAYIKSFVDRKTILDKNQKLDEMYKITEETLKTRTKELNEILEVDRLRTVFFANLSHELRTPLNVIFSAEQMLDVLLKDMGIIKDNLEIGQYMKMIKQNCYRLLRLIANLIDITKIDAGYFSIDMKNCDIVKTVEDITLSVAQYIKDKDINLVFDTEFEERTLAFDPDKIERIILNLLSNAVKFTPQGGSIFVDIYEMKGNVVISVRDTGIGIPEDMLSLIFERFIQVDSTISRNREGSGIGLSIVKSLVEMHGGKISVKSKIGIGSEFIIEFPEKVINKENREDGFNLMKSQNEEKVSIEFSDIYD